MHDVDKVLDFDAVAKEKLCLPDHVCEPGVFFDELFSTEGFFECFFSDEPLVFLRDIKRHVFWVQHYLCFHDLVKELCEVTGYKVSVILDFLVQNPRVVVKYNCKQQVSQ